MGENKVRNTFLTLLAVIALIALMLLIPEGATKLRGAITLFAIWGVATVSLNLINGTLGILSLGHHGFMLIGGYTTALLVLSEDARNRIEDSARSQMNDFTLGLSIGRLYDSLGVQQVTLEQLILLLSLALLLLALILLVQRGSQLSTVLFVLFGGGGLAWTYLAPEQWSFQMPYLQTDGGFALVPRPVGYDMAANVLPEVQFLTALFCGGLLAMLFGLLVGFPSLRLRGDYLAIVTFGFGEIIRLTASTRLVAPFTNGALGFAGVDSTYGKSIWWTVALLALAVLVMSKLKFSSYGRAMEGIREDEIAVQAMGVNLARHKVFGFALSAFFAGIAGGLWVSWLANARLDNFLFLLTFYFLVAISLGGTGSITGVLLGTALVVFVRQYGDPLEESYTLATWLGFIGLLLVLAGAFTLMFRNLRKLRPRMHPMIPTLTLAGLGCLYVAYLGGAQFWPAIQLNVFQAPDIAVSWPWLQETFRGFGMRAIFLSVLLIVIMVFRPEGLIGRSEFSWAGVFNERKDKPTEEERRQDAWLSNPQLNKGASDSASDDAPSAVKTPRTTSNKDSFEGLLDDDDLYETFPQPQKPEEER